MKLADSITLFNLFCGILAILLNELLLGTILILLGALFDFLDGKIARIYGPSKLGAELDSLADLVTFGVAPAVLVFTANTFAVILFPLAAAYRLARFNTQQKKQYFIGLPTPAAAILLLLFAWLPFMSSILLNIIVLALSFLMISTIKVKKL